jgi:flagellar hook-associated protein 1 FlgK
MSGGIFFGINIGLKAMMAQQTAMSVTGHNIANANTPGYSRQVANMSTSFAIPTPSNNRFAGAGQLGTGVDISEVKRIRDEFIDWQIRTELGVMEEWSARHDALSQIEVVFMEPTDTGLSSLMSDFWNSWQELSKNPESSPVRTTVKETAVALAEALRYSYDRLEAIEDGLNTKTEMVVNDANSILEQLERLNNQIKVIRVAGDNPNDLMDERDLLLDRLSEMMDIKVEPVFAGTDNKRATGEIRVLVNAQGSEDPIALVDPDLEYGYQKLNIDKDNNHALFVGQEGPDEEDPNPAKTYLVLGAGELYGLAMTRGADDADNSTSTITYYKEQLDILARGLAGALNEIHREGFTLKEDDDGLIQGSDFFVFLDESGNPLDADEASAQYIWVNPQIEKDVGYIAAGRTEEGEDQHPGNRENALLIAALRNQRFTMGDNGLDSSPTGDLTLESFYQNFVSELGVASSEANRMVSNQNVLVTQLQNRKESVAGVSIDEEVANMISYQHAFVAAARYIRVLDELAATIVNGLKA